MRKALAATTVVLLSLALTACGQSAEDAALENCLAVSKQYVQDHPEDYDTVEKIAKESERCEQWQKDDPEEFQEIFGE